MNFLSSVLKATKHLPALISGAEAMFGKKTGVQKRAEVVEQIELMLNLKNAILAGDVVDEALFREGLGEAISGFVKMQKAAVQDRVKA